MAFKSGTAAAGGEYGGVPAAARRRAFAFSDAALMTLPALVVVAAVGVFLRFYGLTATGITLDETVSIAFANLSPSAIVETSVHLDRNPPLYYLLLHGWVAVFGDSEVAIRSLSALFSSAAIVMLYLVARLIMSAKASVFAALILALSSFQLAQAQNARAYALLVLLTAASFYFLVKLMAGGRPWTSVAYLLVTLALLYTHVYALFVVAAQIAFVLARAAVGRSDRRELKSWAFLCSALLFGYLPWAGVLIHQTRQELKGGFNSGLAGWLDPPSLRGFVGTFSEYSGSRYALLGFVTLALAGVGAQQLRHRLSFARVKSVLTEDRQLLLASWLLVPTVTPFLLSHVLTPMYLAKYTIPAMLAFALVVALLVAGLPLRGFLAAGIAVVILASLGVWRYHSRSETEGWRAVAHYVDAHARSGDSVVLTSRREEAAFRYYADRGGVTTTPVVQTETVFEQAPLDAPALNALSAVVSDRSRVWVVSAKDESKFLSRTLRRTHDQRFRLSFVDVDLFLFEKSV